MSRYKKLIRNVRKVLSDPDKWEKYKDLYNLLSEERKNDVGAENKKTFKEVQV